MPLQPFVAVVFALFAAPPAALVEKEANADANFINRHPLETSYPIGGVHRVSANQGVASRHCSADALPIAERRRMQAEYQRRLRADGKSSADAWVNEQGRRFRERLAAEGVCNPRAEHRGGTHSAERPSEKRVVRDKDGRPCKRTRLENRNIANLGGGAMSMVLVPVCAD
jgi:hypothetical protein